jgi:hypothetical protein
LNSSPIGVDTSVLTPVDDPRLEARLLERIWDGTIEFDSVPGRTCFTVTLPFAQDGARGDVQRNDTARHDAARNDGPRHDGSRIDTPRPDGGPGPATHASK